MNLSNYYWYFKSALTPRFCDDVIKYGLSHQEDLAVIGGFQSNRDLKKQPLKKQEILDLKKKRNSNIVWLNDVWIYKEIYPYINEANKILFENFNFIIIS